MNTEERIENNRIVWNTVYDLFANASSLPFWAPFGVGGDLGLIPEIEEKTFLEIGCGSGRSIKYLIDNGARKVYGLDVSDEQIKESEKFNREAVDKENVQLFRVPMEKRIEIEPVDVVFSIYGFGWTQEPEKTLANIYSYLKPGGLFIWSWDHTFFTDVAFEDGKYVVKYAYHDENPIRLKDWKRQGCAPSITYRKTSTWFKLQKDAGFQIDAYYEPKPKSLYRAHHDPEKYYSMDKAEKVPASFIFVCRKPNLA